MELKGKQLFAVLALLGSFLLVYTWPLMIEMYRASLWPSTSGRVIGSSIETREQYQSSDRNSGGVRHVTVYWPKIVYEYYVDGRAYQYARRQFVEEYTPDKSYAEQVVGLFPSGKQVTVFYDPTTPKESTLDNSLDHVFAFKFFSGLILILVGIVGYVFKRKRNEV